ncbi:MAG: hypothetical protein HY671_13235 [Chloroflexi bacterium]|nr:hypothetical protein [Chloroflexota bacterium]
MSSDEAEARTAISRAYYAAFLVARNRLEIQEGGSEVHQLVVRELYSKKAAGAAKRLQLLRRHRNVADYNTARLVSAAHARMSVQLSEDILAEIAQASIENSKGDT